MDVRFAMPLILKVVMAVVEEFTFVALLDVMVTTVHESITDILAANRQRRRGD